MPTNIDHVLDELAAVLRAEKEALTEGVDWTRRPRAGGFHSLEYAAPISVAGVVPRGLQARLSCRSDMPDADVHAQLQIYVPPIQGYAHLHRVEWRPNTRHTNDGYAPSSLRFRTMKDRYYDFGLNRRLGIAGLRQTKTMIAKELPQIGSFNELLVFLQELWKVSELLRIPPPPWEDRII